MNRTIRINRMIRINRLITLKHPFYYFFTDLIMIRIIQTTRINRFLRMIRNYYL